MRQFQEETFAADEQTDQQTDAAEHRREAHPRQRRTVHLPEKWRWRHVWNKQIRSGKNDQGSRAMYDGDRIKQTFLIRSSLRPLNF